MKIKKIIATTLSILAGVSFGVAFSTYLLQNGYFNTHLRAFVVQSGSMEPAIKTGSMVVSKSQDVYQTGDIITFSLNSNQYITHRIIDITAENGENIYKTKGDANEDPDNFYVLDSHIIGKADITIPYLGYLSAFVRTPRGFVALVVIPASIIIYEELKRIGKEIKKFITKNTRDKPVNEDKAMPVQVMVPLFGILLLFGGSSLSYFSDTESSQGNLLSAAADFENEQEPEGYVVINEVYYDPDDEHMQGNLAESSFEWVELYNNSNQTVNLKNWKIEDNTQSRSITTRDYDFAPGEYVVLAKANNVRVLWDVPPQKFISLGEIIGGGLANGGDELHLKDDQDNIVDEISWGSNTNVLSPPIPDVTEGHSIERSPHGAETDTAADFIDLTLPTPGK